MTDTENPEPAEVLADALQVAWNEWCLDTGCIPDLFAIHGPRTTRVTADFRPGDPFIDNVLGWMRHKGYGIAPLPATSEPTS